MDFRTPPHVSSPELGGASKSRQPYISCTGCQSADEWISRYPPLSIVRWLAPLLCTELTKVTAGYRRWPPSSAACWQSKVLGQEISNQFGDRCFATAGPTLWNSLPEQLRQPDITFGQFKRSLKTFMFGLLGRTPCVWTLRALTRNLLTYLLTSSATSAPTQFSQ